MRVDGAEGNAIELVEAHLGFRLRERTILSWTDEPDMGRKRGDNRARQDEPTIGSGAALGLSEPVDRGTQWGRGGVGDGEVAAGPGVEIESNTPEASRISESLRRRLSVTARVSRSTTLGKLSHVRCS